MLNNAVIMGRLCAAPELKTTPSGTSVVSFAVAVDRRHQKQGEDKKTDFVDCVAWRGTAEFISKYFGKGDMIAIIGEIQTRNYTDKNGNNRKAVEIVVSQASFCGGKKSDSQAEAAQVPESDFPAIDAGSDDLPF